MLIAFAIGLLLAYSFLDPVHAALQTLGEAKTRWGWPFVAVSTALFGGLIPGLVQRVRDTMPWPQLLFFTAFWGVKGLEVDLLYRLQASVFGHGRDPATLFAKVLIDQAVYCPIWAVPSTVAAYAFAHAGFSIKRTLDPWRSGGLSQWYARAVFPVILSNAGVWVPAVCVIYCLPLPLQLPMQNLVLCFWSLLLVLQVGRNR
ncbi:MAG: hypothetical protein AAGG38_03905 [Planctomycetota bacterium]